MPLDMRPWLDQPPPSYHPKPEPSRLSQALVIGVAVALAGFLVALITADVTVGGG